MPLHLTPTSPPQAWQALLPHLARATNIAVLTGAGISAESGLRTFRSNGLWEDHRVEDVATPEAFQKNPALVWRFYNARRAALTSAKPNPAHHALAQLERAHPNAFTLITQNVDGLHQSAGNTDVLELHGSLHRIRCPDCARSFTNLDPQPDLPKCECGSLLRPDIVWFGENLPERTLTRAISATESSDVFLVIGTSAVVHPAAGLISLARRANAFVIELNPQSTDATPLAHATLQGPAGQLLPALVARWLHPEPPAV